MSIASSSLKLVREGPLGILAFHLELLNQLDASGAPSYSATGGLSDQIWLAGGKAATCLAKEHSSGLLVLNLWQADLNDIMGDFRITIARLRGPQLGNDLLNCISLVASNGQFLLETFQGIHKLQSFRSSFVVSLARDFGNASGRKRQRFTLLAEQLVERPANLLALCHRGHLQNFTIMLP